MMIWRTVKSFNTLGDKCEGRIWEKRVEIQGSRGQILKVLVCPAKEFWFYPGDTDIKK